MGQRYRKIASITPTHVPIAKNEVVIGYVDARRTIPIVRATVRKATREPIMETVLDGGKKVERQAWKRNRSGEPVVLKFKRKIVEVVEEYAKVPQPDNSIVKNYNYKPDPAEAERQQEAAAIRAVQEELATKLVREGISVDALVDALKPKSAA